MLQVLELYGQLQQSGEPDLISFNTCIHGLCLEHRWLQAFSILQQCKEQELQPDAASYTSLLSVW